MLTECQREPAGSQRGARRPGSGRGRATSLRNTNHAKTRLFTKACASFPQYFVSSCLSCQERSEDSQRQLSLQGTGNHRCPAPTLLLSLAGAVGDQGLPRLRPGSDRAAGGSVHHVHTPGGTSDFDTEEAEEGTRSDRGVSADGWIWEDLTPSSATRRFWKTAATIICSSYL